MKTTLPVLVFGAVILLSGCLTAHKSDLAALQGTWKGRVIQDKPGHSCSFVIAGSTFEFRDDTDTNVWYKGTFSLREDTTPRQYIAVIKECPFPQYVGKTSMAIYQIKGGVLTITGNGPGDPAVPLSFNAPGAARLEVKRL